MTVETNEINSVRENEFNENAHLRETNATFNFTNGNSTPPILIIRAQPTISDMVPLLFTFLIYALIIQTLCIILKRIYKSMYDRLIFVILLTSPIVFSVLFKKYLFFICWLLYVSLMIQMYYKITRKPLKKELPKLVYATFRFLFMITNLGICVSQGLTFLSFFWYSQKVATFFLSLLFFAYFGLLSREIIFFFSETLATNTGFYSKDGVPSRNNSNTLCMLCTKIFDNTELVHSLICLHSFHEDCIKGWCILAKKKSCPYCKKGVDLETIPKDLWYKTEVWFYPLINTLRNFIVFVIFMSIFILYKGYTS